VTTLKRNVLRFEPECQERIDEIAELASRMLNCEVSRAAVVRAAVQAWLKTSTSIHPEQLMVLIRAEMVKRGRKRTARLKAMPVGQPQREMTNGRQATVE
jgi:hypothetical protein